MNRDGLRDRFPDNDQGEIEPADIRAIVDAVELQHRFSVEVDGPGTYELATLEITSPVAVVEIIATGRAPNGSIVAMTTRFDVVEGVAEPSVAITRREGFGAGTAVNFDGRTASITIDGDTGGPMIIRGTIRVGGT